MTDSAFNRSLDALVRGEPAGGNDELAGFAAGLYRKEHDVMMPTGLKSAIGARLGLDSGMEPSSSAPVSGRTARANAGERDYVRRPWSIAATIVIAVSLALTGVLQWGMQTGDDDGGNRFGLLSPAIPTVEATPAATPPAETRWLAPVWADECPANELVDPGERARLEQEQLSRFEGSPVRIDAPYGEVDADIAEKVVTRQRKMMSCQNSQQMLVLSVRSDQSVYEWHLDDDSEEAQKLNVDRMGRSKQLSGWLEYERGLTHEDLIHQVVDPSAEIGLIWEPDNAVRMADGRVALVPGWITTSAEDTPGFIGFVPVWMETDDGRWLLDEELYFCIGDCEGYWACNSRRVSR